MGHYIPPVHLHEPAPEQLEPQVEPSKEPGKLLYNLFMKEVTETCTSLLQASGHYSS